MRAFLFPGQGSQSIGMGKDIYEAYPEARDVFDRVDAALNQKLSALMFDGTADDLNMTENTQPALMAVSMAFVNVLKKQTGKNIEEMCAYVAGHSLGEYTALTAAGVLELEDTARLLKKRGQAMQKAVPVGVGAMAAIIGLDFAAVQAIAQTSTMEANAQDADAALTVEAANDNGGGQVVVSGHKGAVELAVQYAQDQGAKKAVILPVSAPFHCSLMAPAAQDMSYTLADTTFRPPYVPVVANVIAKATEEPSEMRRLLVDQITGTVRWRESVEWLSANGVTETVEIGAGKVLNGLVRRIHKDMVLTNVGSKEQLESFIETIGNE